MSRPEAALQKAVVEYLRIVLPENSLLWATLNERRMSAWEAKEFKAMGMQKGMADLCVLHGGRMHFIELKVEKDAAWGVPRTTKQTLEQKAVQSAAEAAGGFYAVCRSLGDVRGSLTAFGVPLKGHTVPGAGKGKVNG